MKMMRRTILWLMEKRQSKNIRDAVAELRDSKKIQLPLCSRNENAVRLNLRKTMLTKRRLRTRFSLHKTSLCLLPK